MEENKAKREAEEQAKKKAAIGSKPAFGKPKNMFGSKPMIGGSKPAFKPQAAAQESGYTPSGMTNATPDTQGAAPINQPSSEKKYPWSLSN